MAMFVPAERTTSVTARSARITHVAGHTAAASTSGSNEDVGAGAARAAVSWGTATDDGTTATIVGTFTGLAHANAGATIVELGGWSASTGGTYREKFDIADVTFAGAGTASGTVTLTQT